MSFHTREPIYCHKVDVDMRYDSTLFIKRDGETRLVRFICFSMRHAQQLMADNPGTVFIDRDINGMFYVADEKPIKVDGRFKGNLKINGILQ